MQNLFHTLMAVMFLQKGKKKSVYGFMAFHECPYLHT